MTDSPRSPAGDAANVKLWRTVLILSIIALSLAFLMFAMSLLHALRGIIPIVVGAVLLVYLVAPVIAFLQRVMRKQWAVLITFVVMLVLIVFFAAIVIPPLIYQGAQFAAAIPGATARAQSAISDPNNAFLNSMPGSIRQELALAPQRLLTLITRYGVAIGRQGISAILSAFSLFLMFIIIPVLAVYLLFDYRDLEHGFLGFFPARHQAKALAIVHDLSGVMGAFVRGQVLDGLCVGTMIFILLTIFHVPFALVIAVAAGVFNLIPYAGAVAGFIPSVLLALAYNGWENAVIVGIGFGIIQQIDGDFIVPRIMNASVKLSPVVIIVAIIGFGALFGLLGALLAVPLAAMLRVFKLHFAPAPPMDEFERVEAAAVAQMKFK